MAEVVKFVTASVQSQLLVGHMSHNCPLFNMVPKRKLVAYAALSDHVEEGKVSHMKSDEVNYWI